MRTIAAVVIAASVLFACEDKPGTPDSDAKDVGRQLGKVVKGAKDVATDTKNAVKDVSHGFNEGVGGSGPEQTPDGKPVPPKPHDGHDIKGPVEVTH